MNRSSSSECSGSWNKRPRKSSKTLCASSNQTLCLVRLLLFFRSSQSNRSISRYYLDTGALAREGLWAGLLITCGDSVFSQYSLSTTLFHQLNLPDMQNFLLGIKLPTHEHMRGRKILNRLRILNNPDRPSIIGDKHRPLRLPLGMPHGSTPTPTLLHAVSAPRPGVLRPTSLVADPPRLGPATFLPQPRRRPCQPANHQPNNRELLHSQPPCNASRPPFSLNRPSSTIFSRPL